MPFSTLYHTNKLYSLDIRGVLLVAARPVLVSDAILDKLTRISIKDGRAAQDNIDPFRSSSREASETNEPISRQSYSRVD